jgi:hypothetical protein
MTTIERLQSVIPGQSAVWYARIAAEIDAGKMPMPSLDPPAGGTYSYSKNDLNPLHRTEVFKSPYQSPPIATTSSPNSTPKTPKPSDRLIELCNGNYSTAQRLLTSLLKQNPDKTGQWANEKAVWDLERDRGSR